MSRTVDFMIEEQRRADGQLGGIVAVCGIGEVVKTLAAICKSKANEWQDTPEGIEQQAYAHELSSIEKRLDMPVSDPRDARGPFSPHWGKPRHSDPAFYEAKRRWMEEHR